MVSTTTHIAGNTKRLGEEVGRAEGHKVQTVFTPLSWPRPAASGHWAWTREREAGRTPALLTGGPARTPAPLASTEDPRPKNPPEGDPKGMREVEGFLGRPSPQRWFCPRMSHWTGGACRGSPGPPLPVGQAHALEELGERGVDGQVAGAGLAEAVGLARLLVDRVEIVALLGRVLSVRRRHHEVAAVDDLLAARRLVAARSGPGRRRRGARVGPGRGGRLIGVGVVVVLRRRGLEQHRAAPAAGPARGAHENVSGHGGAGPGASPGARGDAGERG